MPELQKLPLDKIGVDMTYQRPLVRKHVSSIARSFDPEKLGNLTVSQRSDGTYWVIDGQHRLAALRSINHQDAVPCVVYSGLTYDREAKMFATQSDARKIHPIYLYQAKVKSGDPKATTIDAIIRDAGFVIDIGKSDDNILQSPTTLIDIYERGGEEQLREVLAILATVWAGHEKTPPAFFIRGIGAFVYRYRGEYSRERLIQILRRTSLGELTDTAQLYARGLHEAKITSYGRAVTDMYNRHLKAGNGRLPPWDAETPEPTEDESPDGNE